MAASPKAPRDLRGEFRALRDVIAARLSTRPGASNKETARRGAYDTILAKKSVESRKRLDDLLQPKRWQFDGSDEDRGVELLHTHWNHVIRQIVVHLYSRLGGALRQYHTVRVVWRPHLRFGTSRGTNAPNGSVAAVKKQRKEAEDERKKKQAAMTAAYKATLDAILADFAEKRTALREVIDGIQASMDGLMRAEESRLAALAARAPAAMKEKIEQPMQELKRLRIEAKDFQTLSGEDTSRYGSLLRRWNGARAKAAKALV